jgi:hypothetical protein
VFPARYELNSYIVFRKRLVSKRLIGTKPPANDNFCFINMKIMFEGLWFVFLHGVRIKHMSVCVYFLKEVNTYHSQSVYSV